MTAPLILASTSRYRRALLDRLGVPYRAMAPKFDETAVSPAGKTPREHAESLAIGKARSIAEIEPDAIVIGSDQLVALDGRILGKPGTTERAIEQLHAMSGRNHELITAVVVAEHGQVHSHTDITILTMRALSQEEIARYVGHDQPMDCAGSYKIEERGIVLFDRIETADQTAITGLPLIWLTTTLRALGLAIP